MKVQIQSVAKSCDQKIRSIQEFKEALNLYFPESDCDKKWDCCEDNLPTLSWDVVAIIFSFGNKG